MKRWYVAQVYAGYEDIAKKELLKRIEEEGLSELFGQVLVPSAKIKQMFEVDSSAKKTERQLFPGYFLIEMEAAPEAIRAVATTPRVRLLGGIEPVPLAQKEVDRVLAQMKGEVALAPKKSDFVVGSEVEIAEGPFAGFVGIIDTIDDQAEKLTVMVSIFGRMTPVELSFDQVKR